MYHGQIVCIRLYSKKPYNNYTTTSNEILLIYILLNSKSYILNSNKIIKIFLKLSELSINSLSNISVYKIEHITINY